MMMMVTVSHPAMHEHATPLPMAGLEGKSLSEDSQMRHVLKNNNCWRHHLLGGFHERS